MTEARTLVLLRHGRTAWNHLGRLQGHQDVGLDERGERQAETVAPVIAALHPSLVWSSDLERARRTAAAVGAACGSDVVHDPRLREFGFGTYEGLTHLELQDRDPDSFAALRRGDYDRVAHAEPLVDVRDRMVAALTDLRSSLPVGATGVAVSHGAAIRLAVGALLGWPDEQFRTLSGLDNCGWAVLREHPEGTGLRLAAYNRTT